MRYAFDDFEVDTARYELRQAGIVQPLEPQGFNVLVYLLAQRERVVSKDELLERLWPGQHVTEATLTQRLAVIRRALGDNGRTQRYIRTVHGRGYRFIAAVVTTTAAPAAGEPAMAPLPALPLVVGQRQTLFVGREAELALLHERLARALAGERQLVFVSGEAGMGKTTLVEAFVAQVHATTTVWIGRGQCIEHYGAGEAYLPVLEALSRLGREPQGAALRAALQQQAPSWWAHLPALHTADETVRLTQHANLTPARLLRELTDALEQVTATQPLLLVLEDLHWSDVSTLDWLSYVARRRDPARLCILGTYRPGDALAQGHPLPRTVQELSRQQHAIEMPLPYWTVAELTAYLVQRFGTLPFAGALVRLLHQRTNGNPFFLVALVDAMGTPERLEELTVAGSTLPTALPASIRHLIDYQLDALAADDQGLLETASVVGDTFATATVAAARGETIEAVEARCETLARKGQLVYPLGLESWPDGTVSTRYGFRHALYYEVLYARLSLGQRLRLHRQIGDHKERVYGSQASTIATELAMHFRRGQEPQRAVQYLSLAAQQALQRCAYQEALQHLEQGLALLATLPDTPARAQQELSFQLAVGPALMASRGAGAPEVAQTYVRARLLSEHAGTPAQRFPALWGLWRVYHAQAQHRTARAVGDALLALAHDPPDTAILLAAYQALGSTCYFTGEFVLARRYLEQALACYHTVPERAAILHMSLVPAVYCLVFTGQVLWTLGYPEQALSQTQQASAVAHASAHIPSVVFAQYYAARLHMLRGEAAQVLACTAAALPLTLAQPLPYYHALASFLHGWGLVATGQPQIGVAQMQQGLSDALVTGAELVRPLFLVLLAEVYRSLAEMKEAQRLVAEVEGVVASSGQHFCDAEIARLRGALCLQQRQVDTLQAEVCFQQALQIARQQQARSLELRAALSLGRLWQRQGKAVAAAQLVGEIYGWFTEGFETTDLQQARAFLQGVSSAADITASGPPAPHLS